MVYDFSKTSQFLYLVETIFTLLEHKRFFFFYHVLYRLSLNYLEPVESNHLTLHFIKIYLSITFPCKPVFPI